MNQIDEFAVDGVAVLEGAPCVDETPVDEVGKRGLGRPDP
jgi:hypothetical protein